MNIYPTILTDSLIELSQQLQICTSLTNVEVVQIDIIDGFFANDITVTPSDLVGMDFADLKCDLHLMVDEPMDFVLEAEDNKHQLPIRTIIAQLEHMSSQAAFIEEVRAHQWQVGLSLDIDTPLESIDEASWSELKILQLMGNRAGEQGQALDKRIFDKIREAKQMILQKKDREQTIEIVIDAGVRLDNAGRLVKAGADSLAVGSLLWQATDQNQVIADLLSRID